MKRVILAAVLLASTFVFVGCTREGSAERVLHQHGFTEIEITGYSPFSCGEGDDFATGFRAKALNGQTVQGTVCEGLLKGKTVRLD